MLVGNMDPLQTNQEQRDIEREYLDFLDDEVSNNTIARYLRIKFNIFLRDMIESIQSWLKA